MGKAEWINDVLDLWRGPTCVTYVRPMYAMSHAVLWASLMFLGTQRERTLLKMGHGRDKRRKHKARQAPALTRVNATNVIKAIAMMTTEELVEIAKREVRASERADRFGAK